MTAMRTLIARWREDQGATYRFWFLWEERLKNFRSIRRGLMTVLRVREEGAKQHEALEAARANDRTHTEVQGWLRDLGRALGFDVWIAINDRGRALAGGELADGCLDQLPASARDLALSPAGAV